MRKSFSVADRYMDEFAAALASARSSLGEEAFARAWAEGQAMTLDQAVEYALGDEGLSADSATDSAD